MHHALEEGLVASVNEISLSRKLFTPPWPSFRTKRSSRHKATILSHRQGDVHTIVCRVVQFDRDRCGSLKATIGSSTVLYSAPWRRRAARMPRPVTVRAAGLFS